MHTTQTTLKIKVQFNHSYISRGPTLTREDRPAVNTFVSFPLGLLRHVVSLGEHKCEECITLFFFSTEALRAGLNRVTTQTQFEDEANNTKH